VKTLHLTDVVNLEAPFDIIFIAVKSYDTEWATHFSKRLITPTGFFVCSQNGMNDEVIARIVGYDRVVPLVMSGISVGLMEPGHVTRGGNPGRDRGHDVFRTGEMGGQPSPRTQMLADMLECIDASTTTSNIWGERWSKLATNCMGNTLAAMSKTAAGDLAKLTPKFAILRDEVAHELVSVGTALGVRIEPISGKSQEEWLQFKPDLSAAQAAPDVNAVAMSDGHGNAAYVSSWPTSTLQDIIKGRRSEIDYLNGYVSKRGREVGIETPVNDAIVRVLKQVDYQELPADPSNVDRVWELVYGKQPIPVAVGT
jgi:2-dehydropantoate 2-reductase